MGNSVEMESLQIYLNRYVYIYIYILTVPFKYFVPPYVYLCSIRYLGIACTIHVLSVVWSKEGMESHKRLTKQTHSTPFPTIRKGFLALAFDGTGKSTNPKIGNAAHQSKLFIYIYMFFFRVLGSGVKEGTGNPTKRCGGVTSFATKEHGKCGRNIYVFLFI